jgi:large-conductance mechanosensitive channel
LHSEAASALINAFVKDIIDPFIGLFLPAGNLAALTIKEMDKRIFNDGKMGIKDEIVEDN